MSTQLLTIPQAADRLAMSVDTVQRAITAGHLDTVRVGRSVRIAEADLEAFINARRGSHARSLAMHPSAATSVVPMTGRRRKPRRYIA